MRTALKKASIAAVAAVALLATMAEASSSGDSSSETTASSAAAAEGTDTTESAPAEEAAGPGIGDEARDGKFAFTVSKIKCGVKKVGNEFLNSKAQGQFCLVTMTVKNIGEEAQSFDASSQKGQTNTGATVDADSSASLYANEDANTFFNEINPGNSLKNVVVVYDIAEDQTIDALELHDSMFSEGVIVATK
jgi:hypothetical protein